MIFFSVPKIINITKLLNVCYISINSIDFERKWFKMLVVKKGFNMRIISGKARGTKLFTLKGENTRPTLDRVKESLFNIIQNKIQGSTFLDLFSGSGAIGLEALSRGAKKAILCDKSKEACEIIRKNIEKAHLKNEAIIFNTDFRNFIQNKINEKIDIVFLDPPYETNFAIEAIKLILEEECLNEDSIIIIETDDKQRIIEKINNINCEIEDIRKYGRSYLIFLKKYRT